MKKAAIFFLLFSVASIMTAQTNTSVLASGIWYKFSVNETGIFKITYNDLLSMGISVNAINPNNIRVYGNSSGMLPQLNNQLHPDDLKEMAIEVIGEDDNIFNIDDYILFYGQSPVVWKYNQDLIGFEQKLNLYSDNTYYFLNFDIGAGKRIQQRQSLNITPTDTIITFDDYQYHEVETYNFVKSGKKWYGEHFDTITNYNFSFNFPNIVTSVPVKINSVFAARSSTSSNFSILANGNSIATVSIPAVNLSLSTSAFACELQRNIYFSTNSDIISIEFNYNKPNSSSQGWLNYLTLNVRRNLIMSGSQMAFRDGISVGAGKTALFKLNGVQSGTKIWDVTDPVNVIQQVAEQPASGNEFSFVTNTDEQREFIAFQQSNYKTPVFFGSIVIQNLHGLSSVNLLIVTDELFLNNANTLADFHRTHDNLSVQVVTTKQIYNEFSTGSQDISAIRNFAKMIYFKGFGTDNALKNLLLFGDASYDYKNRIPNNTNFVPTYESDNSLDPTTSYLSDDFFALLDSTDGSVDGDETLEIGVGRLPVKNVVEANDIVSKIIKYASNPVGLKSWRTDVCFVADDAEDVTQHQNQANELANKVDTIQPCLNINKIFLDDYVQDSSATGYSYPTVNAAIDNQIEKGALIVNYTGHGNQNGWTHEHVLTIPMIVNWTNTNNLPLFLTATCEFGRFDNPAFTSAAELISLHPNGGGIALMTTTRLVYSTPNFYMNLCFYDYIFAKDENNQPLRLGEVLRRTKNDPRNGIGINKRNFTLLGDPALILAYPKYNVSATHVNGNSIQNPLDVFYPGNNLIISGHVTDNSNLVINNFNGEIHYRLYDKERMDTTLGNDGREPLVFHRQDNILMEGDANVNNGLFEITMTIPGNIGPGFGKPKFSFYAENQSIDAMGCFDELEIYGYMAAVEENKIQDMTVSVYPTVTSDYLLCESGDKDFEKTNVSVFDLSGRSISVNHINKKNQNMISVDVSNLESGLYFIRFTNENNSIAKRFIRK